MDALKSHPAYPVLSSDGSPIPTTVFLSEVINQDNFRVGPYTYASDFDAPKDWATRLAPYLFPGDPGGLTIGKFCAIAHGTRFITAGANHATDGFSTYPFQIFDPERIAAYKTDRRETCMGNDVWFGAGAIVLSGARIGSGAIIGAGTVVRGTVPDYAVVTGNPGTVQRMRFTPKVIETLLQIAWWDWPIDTIVAAQHAIQQTDLEALQAFKPNA